MLQVAKTMANLASERSDNSEYINRMYMLGFLHDVGRFVDNENHEMIGARLLPGYEYGNEIYYHGKLDDYSSDELDMLYLADMTTGPNGEVLSVKERLTDIKDRYGESSSEYQDSCEIAEYLKDKFGIEL